MTKHTDDVAPFTVPRQTVVRVRPPEDHKDWNAAWQANSESVKQAWAEAFRGLERGLEAERKRIKKQKGERVCL